MKFGQFVSYYKSSSSAAFEDWTMILSSPLLITFAWTKALVLPPMPSTTPSPWLVAKYFLWERLLCFRLSDWRKITMNLFLNFDDGPPDHIISCNYCVCIIKVVAKEVYKQCYSIFTLVMTIWHNFLCFTYWFIGHWCGEKLDSLVAPQDTQYLIWYSQE